MIYACSEEGVAVVPYGGGTSVVGGLEPLRGRYGALISLDLGRLEGLRVVRRALARRRGCAAGRGCRRPTTRSARTASRSATRRRATSGRPSAAASRRAPPGQSSTGHGRIEDNVVALRCATPVGALATLAVPATAAGPSLKRLVIGSEGSLGRDHEVGLRVRPLPRRAALRGLVRALLRRGRGRAAAARAGRARARRRPAVRRGRDAACRWRWPARGGLKGLAGRALLRARGYAEGCLMICGWEGDADRDRAPPRRRGALLKRAGAMAAGRAPGARLAGLALRRPAPARRPARPRRARRDARDGDDAGPTSRHLNGAVTRRARGHAGRAAGDVPRLAPVRDRRLALLHGAGGAGRATTRSRSGSAAKAAATRRDRRHRRHDLATTTRSARTTRRGCRRRSARWGTTCCARSRSAATRPGIMNPGKLLLVAALLAAAGGAPTSTTWPGFSALPSVSRVTTTCLTFASQRGNLRGPRCAGRWCRAGRWRRPAGAKPSRCGRAGAREPDGVGLAALFAGMPVPSRVKASAAGRV